MKAYKIKQEGDKWIVTDESGEKVLGTHDTEEAAKKQLAAIEASKAKAKKMEAVFGVEFDFESDLQTIADIELFKEGTWRGVNSPPEGDKYTADDLQAIVEAFEAGVLKPNLKITHGSDNEQIDIGQVANLKVKGGSLFGDFVNVPKALYELMKKGLFKARSAEILWGLKDSAGKVWSRVLKAVALLAPGQTPALPLVDGYQFEAFYTYEVGELEPAQDNDKDNNIDDKGGEQVDEKLQELLAKYEAKDIDELNEIIDEKLADLDAKSTQIQEFEAEKVQLMQAQRQQFISEAKDSGQLLPRHEKLVVALFEAVESLENKRTYAIEGKDEEEGTATDMLKAFITDLPKLVDLQEQSQKDDSPTIDSQKAAAGEVDRLAKHYVTEGEADDYEAALELVKDREPELWAKYLK